MSVKRSPPKTRSSQRSTQGQPPPFLVKNFDLSGSSSPTSDGRSIAEHLSPNTVKPTTTHTSPTHTTTLYIDRDRDPAMDELLAKFNAMAAEVESMKAEARREKEVREELEHTIVELRSSKPPPSDPPVVSKPSSASDTFFQSTITTSIAPVLPISSLSGTSGICSGLTTPTSIFGTACASTKTNAASELLFTHSIPSTVSWSSPIDSILGSTIAPPPQQVQQTPVDAPTYQYRRPKLYDLPNFTGKPEEWPKFVANFRLSTSSWGYNNLENTMRLQKCLSGPALEAVDCLLIYPDNVEQIIQTLELRFGRPEDLVRSQIQKARALPQISPHNLQQLLPFASVVQNLCAFLNTPSTLHHLANPTLIDELVGKLPPAQQLEWVRHSIAIKPYPDLRHFSIWMTSVSTLIARCPATLVNPSTSYEAEAAFSQPNEGRKRSNAQTTPNNNNMLLHTFDRSSMCNLCSKAAHSTDKCPTFVNQSVNDRWESVKERRLCFGCLRRGHSLDLCRSRKKCNVEDDGKPCRYVHHPLLHSKVQSTQQSPSDTSEPTCKPNPFAKNPEPTPSTSSNTSATDRILNCQPTQPEQNLLFRIVPVTLHGPSKSIETHALLDEGSSVTLLDEDMAVALELAGKPDVLHLQWFGSRHAAEPTRVVDVGIQGNGRKSQRFQLHNVRTVQNMDLPAQTVRFSELHDRYNHIPALPIADIENAQPKILIGLDNCHLGVANECFSSEGNSPIAVNTKLGWIVFGPNKATEPSSNVVHQMLHVRDHAASSQALVKEFFSTESFGVTSSDHVLESTEDARACTIHDQTTVRVGNRFQCGLLWKQDGMRLPESHHMALNRLLSLEIAHAMQRDPSYAASHPSTTSESTSASTSTHSAPLSCRMHMPNVAPPPKDMIISQTSRKLAHYSSGTLAQNYIVKKKPRSEPVREANPYLTTRHSPPSIKTAPKEHTLFVRGAKFFVDEEGERLRRVTEAVPSVAISPPASSSSPRCASCVSPGGQIRSAIVKTPYEPNYVEASRLAVLDVENLRT